MDVDRCIIYIWSQFSSSELYNRSILDPAQLRIQMAVQLMKQCWVILEFFIHTLHIYLYMYNTHLIVHEQHFNISTNQIFNNVISYSNQLREVTEFMPPPCLSLKHEHPSRIYPVYSMNSATFLYLKFASFSQITHTEL